MNKDYTVIYADYFMIGSCRNYATKQMYINCTKENLISEIEKTVDFGCVLFLFDGICKNAD
jgi:hypothetical protein